MLSYMCARLLLMLVKVPESIHDTGKGEPKVQNWAYHLYFKGAVKKIEKVSARLGGGVLPLER